MIIYSGDSMEYFYRLFNNVANGTNQIDRIDFITNHLKNWDNLFILRKFGSFGIFLNSNQTKTGEPHVITVKVRDVMVDMKAYTEYMQKAREYPDPTRDHLWASMQGITSHISGNP